ncbi:uncharacterized protein B0P05DRAFT_526406 [Gilbertella persicaria]|uniref:uncharacterized protein n=1 Tax=Gilbertella persicaria TaxID=101096 RepID=UPI00221F8D18|nr:uncharacterized protein B0P05DRAFT_526406 [Gilbertella persicaria]KAI8092452.1 hypothetical protein B0P05DRAFT_526406 [Gilbertella persicaria]
MSYLEDPEDIISQCLRENDPIQEIYSSLKSFMQLDIRPEFCSTLFVPTIHHAAKNAQSASQITIYSKVLEDLYNYVLRDDPSDDKFLTEANQTIKELASILRKDKIKFKYFAELQSLYPLKIMSLLDINIHFISTLIVQNRILMSDPVITTVWNLVSFVLAHLIKLHYQSETLIKASLDLIVVCIQERLLVCPDNWALGTHLESLLLLWDQGNLLEDHKDKIAIAISSLVAFSPSNHEGDIIHLASLARSLIAKELPNCNYIRAQALYYTLCMLTKNSIQFMDQIESQSSLGIMKDKITMLLMSSHPPLNSQAMDIDQDVSGTAALLRSDLLNGNVRNRVQTIVNHLTSTQTKDDQNHNLIEQIREISIQTGNTDVSVLFYSQMKQIVQFVTRILSVDSDLAGNISELFGYDIPQFLLHNMHFALYYAITCHDQHVLANLALALETKVVTLCQQNGHHIIIALTMEEDQTVAQSVIERLIKILRVKEPIRHLAQKHMTKITISLAMNLGDVKQKQKAIDALRNMSHITNVKLSEHLSLYMLGILEKVNGYISTKRNGNQKIHYPFALESMIEIMVLLDEKLENYILHLIKLFQGVNKLSGMQSQALSLWTMFISCVTKNILAQHLNTITQSLIDLFRVSEAKIRQKVIQTLEDLLVTGYTFEANQYSNLPLLPQFKEFNALKQHIKVKATSANPQTLYKQELEHILKDLCEADDMPIQIALDKLQKLLTDYPNESLHLETLYSRLLYILHKYATHKPISLKAAICLGKLGALDPGLISVSTIDDTVFIMNNFRREDEVGEFVCDLITNYLYPAHNASNDNNMRACIEYAIKPLLDCARFQPIENMTKSDERVNPAAYRWRKLPNSIQQFIAPFFVAAYEATWETHTSAYPIFAKAQNFKGWLQAWFLRMVHSSEGVAKEVFQAFIPIVKSNMLDITRHLIPYLVLHNLLSGSPEDIRGIIDELMNVIHVNANLNPHHDLGKNTFNHYALQVCVETTEYCRKWLNRVGRNDLEKESQVKRINTFLQEIPRRDMGIAAFHTKAYPQALMQFETFIKEKKNGQLDHDIMDYLRQIYIQIEDPIDLKVLMDTYTTVLTLDERITRYESLGRWDQAQVLYKGKIREKDSDLSAYMGYMECLRKSGSYDKMIYEADTMLHDLPRWLPNINSYKIDAAWRLQNWDKLDQTVSLPIHRDIPALIGCILNDMRKKNYTDAASCIEEARYKVIEQLTISHSKSYRKSYPLLFDLQLLQELEESQKIWELTDPTEDLNKLEQRWKKTFKNIIPHAQYQLNLLQLRKAAYFDIRPTNQFSVNAHQTWLAIAKINRKAGNMTLAADAIQQAEEQSKQTLYRDRAKWLWKDGYPKEAAELLLSKINHGGVGFEEALLYVEIDLENDLEGDAKSMVKIINREGQFDGEKAEKANHNCVKWYAKRLKETQDKFVEVNIKAYLVKRSISALEFGSKYYYSSMSTLLNCWFEVATLGSEIKSESPNMAPDITTKIKEVNEIMHRITISVPLFQFILFLPRFISNLSIDNDMVAASLMKIILEVFAAYPRNTIWLMLGALESPITKVRTRIKQIFQKAKEKYSHTVIPSIILQAFKLREALHDLSEFNFDPKSNLGSIDMATFGTGSLLPLRDLDLYMPRESCMLPTQPEVIKKSDRNFDPFPSNLPTIARIEHKILVMRSLQMPKRITIVGSDGKLYKFLVKKEDDLRKDARTMEFSNMINTFLRKNPQARDSGLYIRTFAVVPLGHRWGLIEWIDNLNALKAIVNDYWVSEGHASVNSIGAKLEKIKLGRVPEKLQVFERCLANSPSVFYKWFLKNFPEPNQWLNSRTRYIKTLAVMSIVGYCIGLGDRHAENIMFDQTNGDCVHVDLNMLFESGSGLPTPEIVPFRLTHNLVDALGVLGYKGIFQHTCELTLQVLLNNREALLAVFETHINEIESARNNGSRNILRVSGSKATQDMIRLRTKFDTKPEQINSEVNRLIKEATSKENLCQMYHGWAPFI